MEETKCRQFCWTPCNVCYRHDDAQQGEDEVHGPVRGAGVEGVARPVIETPGVTIIIQYLNKGHY